MGNHEDVSDAKQKSLSSTDIHCEVAACRMLPEHAARLIIERREIHKPLWFVIGSKLATFAFDLAFWIIVLYSFLFSC